MKCRLCLRVGNHIKKTTAPTTLKRLIKWYGFKSEKAGYPDKICNSCQGRVKNNEKPVESLPTLDKFARLV